MKNTQRFVTVFGFAICLGMLGASSTQAQPLMQSTTTETTHWDTNLMRYGGVTLGAGLTIILGGAIVSFDGIGHDRWLEGFNGFLFGGAIGLIGLVLLTIGGIHRAKRKQNLRDQQKAQVRRKLSFTGDGFRLRF